MQITEDIEIHNQLNPKFWKNNKLLPEVRDKLLEVVMAFKAYADVPIDIIDIQLCGSNASYNYTAKSDLDTHIIANFDIEGIDSAEAKSILQKLYDAKKAEFNSTYDISVHGNQVELYVQDVKAVMVSNGIYSVCEDTWVKEPKPLTSVKHHDTSEEVTKWRSKIYDVIANTANDPEATQAVLNKLYLIRHNSLAVDGEFGKGNQLFKDLRAEGLIQALKDALKKDIEKRLSLEGLSLGQIAHRY